MCDLELRGGTDVNRDYDLHMKTAILYSIADCGGADDARALLEDAGVTVHEQVFDRSLAAVNQLLDRTGRTVSPQVLLEGRIYGQFDLPNAL